MPRQKDLSEIPTARRSFIKTSEWESGETRNFYYTGYEKVTLQSKKTGKDYTQYYFYLLPIGADGKPTEEMTLGIFVSQAAAFKNAGITDYQEIKVTKVVSQGERGEQEDWEVVGLKNVLPEAERPAELDYPEMKSAPAAAEYAPTPAAAPGEINLDDIPF